MLIGEVLGVDPALSMGVCHLIAPAKINLYLEILGNHLTVEPNPQPDGFHELIMVMQSIQLSDEVELRLLGREAIIVHCHHPEVPQDRRNLAYRAAELMACKFPSAYAQYGGVEITVTKHIPVGAGLAGGSTDAAAVLMGLDLLWRLGLTQEELLELGAQLGSDVPFCLLGGTAIATGRGEVLDPLPKLEPLYVVLGKYRHLSVSTPWAYQTYRQQFSHTYLDGNEAMAQRRSSIQSESLIAAILQNNPFVIGQQLFNHLERVVLPNYPPVQQLRDIFQHQPGILGAMMSGSGPTVFGLTTSQQSAEALKLAVQRQLPEPDLDLWVTQFVDRGVCLQGSWGGVHGWQG